MRKFYCSPKTHMLGWEESVHFYCTISGVIILDFIFYMNMNFCFRGWIWCSNCVTNRSTRAYFKYKWQDQRPRKRKSRSWYNRTHFFFNFKVHTSTRQTSHGNCQMAQKKKPTKQSISRKEEASKGIGVAKWCWAKERSGLNRKKESWRADGEKTWNSKWIILPHYILKEMKTRIFSEWQGSTHSSEDSQIRQWIWWQKV